MKKAKMKFSNHFMFFFYFLLICIKLKTVLFEKIEKYDEVERKDEKIIKIS